MLELVPVPVGMKVQVLPRGSSLPSLFPGSQNNAEAPEVGSGDPRESPGPPRDVTPWPHPVSRGTRRPRHRLAGAFSLCLLFFSMFFNHPPPAKVAHLSLAMENKGSPVAKKKERDGFPWQLPSQTRVAVTGTTQLTDSPAETHRPRAGDRGAPGATGGGMLHGCSARWPHHRGLFTVSLQTEVLGGPWGELCSPKASPARVQSPGRGAAGRSEAIFPARQQPKVIIACLGPSSISAV